MATNIDHSVEKTEAFIAKLQEYNINYINPFILCCLCNDIYLKDYNYCPQLRCGQMMYLWTSKNTNHTLNISDIRFIFDTYVVYAIIELQAQYLTDVQKYETSDEKYERCQRIIKKCSEFCIMLFSGVVYKEFINCYKNGYLN